MRVMLLISIVVGIEITVFELQSKFRYFLLSIQKRKSAAGLLQPIKPKCIVRAKNYKWFSSIKTSGWGSFIELEISASNVLPFKISS